MAESKEKLLKDKRVVEEINRHLWIESERAGYDVGFENAAADWLENFSKSWMKYYMPEKKTVSTAKKPSRTKTKSKKNI